MFNKKQQENIIKECPDPFKDKVKCITCKCWVDKNDAQLLKYPGIWDWTYDYYCQAHKKPYDRVNKNCYPFSYYKEIPVDENGEPIGYTKNKTKNDYAK